MRTETLRQREGTHPFIIVALGLIATLAWWWFAFLPVSPETPEWLVRAQAVCFGNTPNGLPAAYGWMLLLLGPGSIAVCIAAIYGDEIRGHWKSIARDPIYRGVALALLVLTLAETVWVGRRIQAAWSRSQVSFDPSERGELPEHYPRLNRPLPNFRLVNQKGEQVTPESYRGKPILLTFAFAHCQTVCPVLVKNTLRAAGRLPVNSVQILFITLDPWRDTPASLKDLAEKWEFPSNAQILSGDVPLVTGALDQLQVPWQRDEKTGDVVHPALVYVVDRDGKIAYAFNNPPDEWLIAAVGRLSGSQGGGP